jgi:hypothetical protein
MGACARESGVRSFEQENRGLTIAGRAKKHVNSKALCSVDCWLCSLKPYASSMRSCIALVQKIRVTIFTNLRVSSTGSQSLKPLKSDP